MPTMLTDTPGGYATFKKWPRTEPSDGHPRSDLAWLEGLLPDGVGGVVGARLRGPDLGHRAGVGAAGAHRVRPVRLGAEARCPGERSGGGIELVLLRGGRDQQEPVPKGRL